jgi:hypothetical protein
VDIQVPSFQLESIVPLAIAFTYMKTALPINSARVQSPLHFDGPRQKGLNIVALALTTVAIPVMTYLQAFVLAHVSAIVVMSTFSAHLFAPSLAVSLSVP